MYEIYGGLFPLLEAFASAFEIVQGAWPVGPRERSCLL